MLERASARETAARVAARRGRRGVPAPGPRRRGDQPRRLHRRGRRARRAAAPSRTTWPRSTQSPVRAFDPRRTEAMVAEVEAAKEAGDTLGGVVEVIAYGLPPGLGSHVHWDRRLDARLAAALMGIQAMKGVEIGDGFDHRAPLGSARRTTRSTRRAASPASRRRSNRAGGLEGGMTNGEPLRVRVAMKPISTVPRALATVDVATGEPAVAHPPALRRLRGAARPAWCGGRWWRSCSPRPRWRSSAATRVRETRRNVAGLPRRRCDRGQSTPVERRRPRREPGGPGRTARARARRPSGRLLAERTGRGVPRHRRRHRGDGGQDDPRHLRQRRRAGVPRARGARRWAPRWPSTTACSRSAAARCSTEATRALLAGHTGGVPRRRAAAGGAAHRPVDGAGPLLAGVNPRATFKALLRRSAGRCTARWPPSRSTPTARTPERRGRRASSTALELADA